MIGLLSSIWAELLHSMESGELVAKRITITFLNN